MVSNQDITKPLMEEDEIKDSSIDYINQIIEKCKKKSNNKRKLEKETLKEINSLIIEINDRICAYIADEGKKYHALQFLNVTLESFILFMKDKLNSNLVRLQNFERINNKLLDDDEDVSETIRYFNDSANKNLVEVKNVLQSLESIESTYASLSSKGPKFQKRKFSDDENIMKDTPIKQENLLVKSETEEDDAFRYTHLNNDYKIMNKWMGFFSLLFFGGSMAIMITFLWNNA